MKKSLALLALAALFIGTTSCRKKDEPKTPVVSTDPNTTDASADVAAIKNSQAVLTVPAGSVVYIKPQTGLKILGATMDATDKTKYTVGSNGLLGINGNVEKLELESDDITDLTLSKPSPLLKTLVLVTKTQYAKKVAETKIDLSGLTDLESLVVAGYTIETLDLTKQTKLKKLAVGAWDWSAIYPQMAEVYKPEGENPEKATKIKEVKLPANNVIEHFAVRSSELIKLNADLGNKPKLRDISFQNASLSKLAVSNATELDLKGSSADAIAVEFDNIPAKQAFGYIVKRANKTVTSITLKNIAFSETNLVNLIKKLETSNGTLKIKGDLLTAKVKAELAAKHWTGIEL